MQLYNHVYDLWKLNAKKNIININKKLLELFFLFKLVW
jgi:hypothetical protein